MRLALLVASAVWLAGLPAAAASRCEKPCKVETAACIRDRCAGSSGEARHACVETCRGIGGCAAIRTLAYVWNECRSDARGVTFRRELRVRRGNCAPVTIQTIGPAQPAPDPYQLCALYGAVGNGAATTLLGGFQRLAVTPDGSGVVFEVSNGTVFPPSVFGGLSPDPTEEGFFYVRADGTGRRRLGPPSRVSMSQFVPNPSSVLGLGYDIFGPLTLNIAFSRDGRTVAYPDLGPGPGGEEAGQVVTLDIATGRRTQLTSLPPPAEGVVNGVRFVDKDTIVFLIDSDLAEPLHFFTVKTDGSGFAPLPEDVPAAGGAVIPDFSVVGGGTDLLTIAVPGAASDFPARPQELFVYDGKNLLQLTSFGRADTLALFLGSRRRALFTTGADPFGTNPGHLGQVFSVDTLGRGLRQVTRLVGTPLGCGEIPAFGSNGTLGLQDPVTDTIVFTATCGDIRGSGFTAQMFAIRPDGSGLRQLTAARGCVVDADGAVTVEMPGPFGYSAPSR
jgi:hypothetical protein